MKITREQLKSIVGEVLQEESDYQDYFKAMLKKHGVSSPAQFKSDEERKNFFNKVDAGWDQVHERIKEARTAQQQRVEALRIKEAEEQERLQQEAEEKAREIEEANQKIDAAISALESLRPVAEEEHEEDNVTPMEEAKWKKK